MIYFLTLSFGVCLFYVFNAVEAQQTMLLLSEQQHALLQTGTAMLGYLSVFISFVLAGLFSMPITSSSSGASASLACI